MNEELPPLLWDDELKREISFRLYASLHGLWFTKPEPVPSEDIIENAVCWMR